MIISSSYKKVLQNKEINWVDMHHHSTVSDGLKTPEQLANVFLKNGNGLCLTDHNQIRGSMILDKQKGLFTIPSIELTTKESKDILAYFYSAKDMAEFYEKEVVKKIRNNKGFNLNKTMINNYDMLDLIEDYNGISVLAHPLALRPKKSIDLLKDNYFYNKVNAIEAVNYQVGKFKKTFKVIKKYDKDKKPLTAGTDSHTISKCEALTGTNGFTVEEFLKFLLKKEAVLYYKRKLPSVKGAHEKSVVVRKNISVPRPKFPVVRVPSIRIPSPLRPRFFYKR